MAQYNRGHLWKLRKYEHTERSAWLDDFHWAPEKGERQRLREETKLKSELDALGTEWQKILRIVEWVHHLPSEADGGSEGTNNHNAFYLLLGGLSGEVPFRCVEFGFMLNHTLSAFGFPSRVVTIMQKECEQGIGRAHVLTDVWCNDFNKWIAVDAALNQYYCDQAGNILSAIELRKLVREARWSDIIGSRESAIRNEYAVWGPGQTKEDCRFDEIFVPEGFTREEMWDSLRDTRDFECYWKYLLSLYYHVAWSTKHSLIEPLPQNSLSTIFLCDSKEMPPIVFQSIRRQLTFTCESARVNFPINGVEVRWQLVHEGQAVDSIEKAQEIMLVLRQSMPWFSHYQVRIGEREFLQEENFIPVRLKIGETRIEITPINDCNRIGRTAYLTVVV